MNVVFGLVWFSPQHKQAFVQLTAIQYDKKELKTKQERDEMNCFLYFLSRLK